MSEIPTDTLQNACNYLDTESMNQEALDIKEMLAFPMEEVPIDFGLTETDPSNDLYPPSPLLLSLQAKDDDSDGDMLMANPVTLSPNKLLPGPLIDEQRDILSDCNASSSSSTISCISTGSMDRSMDSPKHYSEVKAGQSLLKRKAQSNNSYRDETFDTEKSKKRQSCYVPREDKSMQNIQLKQEARSMHQESLLVTNRHQFKRESAIKNTHETRQLHNAMERQRRRNLVQNFTQLKDVVPEIQFQVKTSQLTILNKALEHCNELVTKEKILDEEKTALLMKNFDLRHRLHELMYPNQ